MLAVAALLSFLAWRFSFRLREAAFLLLLPPLSFLAMGTSLWTALIDDHAPFCHIGATWPSDHVRQFRFRRFSVRHRAGPGFDDKTIKPFSEDRNKERVRLDELKIGVAPISALITNLVPRQT